MNSTSQQIPILNALANIPKPEGVTIWFGSRVKDKRFVDDESTRAGTVIGMQYDSHCWSALVLWDDTDLTNPLDGPIWWYVEYLTPVSNCDCNLEKQTKTIESIAELLGLDSL